LHFLSALRDRFIETLKLETEDVIYPENSQLYVAIGAAVSSSTEKVLSFEELRIRLDNDSSKGKKSIKNIEALFKNEKEYLEFKERHNKHKVDTMDFKNYKGR